MNSTATATLIPTGTWAVDPAHSTVGFSVKHLGIATVRGRFEEFEGTLELGDDLSAARAYGTAQVSSINTDEPARDEHLRSPDFLDVASYPTMDFRSTAVTGSGDHWRVEGELTIRGTSRPVTLDVRYEGLENDPWGGTRAAFSATTELEREAFGLTWNQVLESGGLLVGKKVRIDLEIEVVRAA